MSQYSQTYRTTSSYTTQAPVTQTYTTQTYTSSPALSSLGGLTDVDGAKAVARRLFELFDTGKKGKLDNNDVVPMIGAAFKTFQPTYNPTQEDVKAYNKTIDRNGDGIVTLQDIEELAIRYLVVKPAEEKVKKAAKYSSNVEAKLDVARRLFKRFDKDGSGHLQEEEIAGLLSATYAEMGMANFTPTKDDVRIWLQMADSNSDGSVSLEEYEDLIIKSLQKAGIKVEKNSMVF